MYQDSFGNIGPANPTAIALGIYPPPISSTAPGQPAGAKPKPPKSPGKHAARRRGAHPEDDAPVSCGSASGDTYYSSGWPKYNILLIMVDQMRNPTFWPPTGTGGQSSLYSQILNISSIRNASWVFPNYFVAATSCTPSRSTLLTGLYTTQTCIFRTQNPDVGAAQVAPPLVPYSAGGFPSIGDVLSQCLPIEGGSSTSYDCTWIGKWHVSCDTGTTGNTGYNAYGENGPSDYGFSDLYSLPNTTSSVYPNSAYPSPNGMQNEGNGGDFLDSYASGLRDYSDYSPPSPASVNSLPTDEYLQLNDSAIATAFGKWLTYAEGNLTSKKWFCAVSFINPHDMSDFPYSYGLCPATPESGVTCGTDFCSPLGPPSTFLGYPTPPTSGPAPSYTVSVGPQPGACTTECNLDSFTIEQLPAPYYTGTSPTFPPANWNNSDDPEAQPYANYNTTTKQYGKPGLQAFYEQSVANFAGSVNSQNGWMTFLNYYFWMQNSVDEQIGLVLNGNEYQPGFLSSSFADQTVIIFTSDHGDYAGSHNLHAKGGALYDEVMNVPLYISFPSQRKNQSGAQVNPYVCSSVDMLPFLYTLALGNHSWRSNPNDLVYYLAGANTAYNAGREDIFDAIFATAPVRQRRISAIPLANSIPPPEGQEPADWNYFQPFVLHTTDEYSAAYVPPGTTTPQPSHAIAFRTVDYTQNYNSGQPWPNDYPPPYGGGKLGVYNYWDVCDLTTAPVTPDPDPVQTPAQQFELYNYSNTPPGGLPAGWGANPGEIGNQYWTQNGSGQQIQTGEATLYANDFNTPAGSPPNHGINIQSELYAAPTQLAGAMQTAFCNYIDYLEAQTPSELDCHSGEEPPSSCSS